MGGEKTDPATQSTPKRLPKLVLGGIQLLILSLVMGVLAMLGLMLFRQPMLERYLREKTGYICTIGSFDFDPKASYIELHNVTIWNRDPFPHVPLGKVTRARLEWNPTDWGTFPRKLKLLDLDVQSITIIRLNGNRFNILDFVEAVDRAWGSKSDAPTPLQIEESRICWDYVVTLDEEKAGRRMELLLEYKGEHHHVTRLAEITDPPMELAKSEVDGFFFFNYLGDSLKNLLR